MKSAKIFSKEYSLLWNLMMSLESNVVTREETAFMYSFDFNKQEDVVTLFDLYVKEYFLNLSKDRQDETLQAIDHILEAENELMNDFFEYEFGFAPQEPTDRKKFMEEVKAILISYCQQQIAGLGGVYTNLDNLNLDCKSKSESLDLEFPDGINS